MSLAAMPKCYHFECPLLLVIYSRSKKSLFSLINPHLYLKISVITFRASFNRCLITHAFHEIHFLPGHITSSFLLMLILFMFIRPGLRRM